MISVTDLKSGTTFEEKGQIFQVQSYEHIKMGRGSANVKLKIKNLKTGSIIQKSFISSAKVNEANLTKKPCQYLYQDAKEAYFMDCQTFEQFAVPMPVIKDQIQYLREGMELPISFYDDEPLSVDLPIKVEFTVLEAGASIRGDSATNIFKDAILDNGMKAKVPLFIKVGDKVRIDTRTGTYVERAS